MSVSKKQFKKTVNFIIDNLEGGYYHPDMLKDGRIKDTRYSRSGETMFGIDRLRGGTINNTKAGKEFWNIIDNADARHKWKWNYKGGKLEDKLKDLVAEMMYPQYLKLSERYLTDKSKKVIEKDHRLLFNFVYAVWNGSGWFKKFAERFNEQVEKGIVNKKKLTDFAVSLRTQNPNSLIRQGGKKIERIIDNAPKTNTRIITGLTIIILLAIILIISKKYGIHKQIYRKFKNRK